jgi:hypothetical protein
MQRRALLKGLAVGIPTTAGAAAAASTAYLRDTGREIRDEGLAVLSLGLDISALF